MTIAFPDIRHHVSKPEEDPVGNDPITSEDTAETAQDVVDETMVEEVSIDGMCGVY